MTLERNLRIILTVILCISLILNGCKKNDGLKGMYLGCSPTERGMFRLDWGECPLGVTVNSNRLWLGKKIKLESMPENFQICANRLIKAWNDALKYDDDKHWDAWVRA